MRPLSTFEPIHLLPLPVVVMWVHTAYLELEEARRARELVGEYSLNHLAFLRTGCLVSANGDDIDDHINPEGTAQVFAESTDEYYRVHGIKTFRDLLRCSDKQCGHVQQERAAIPVIAREEKNADNAVVKRRFTELKRSRDERAVLLVRVLQHGFMWAGSSFIVFISRGVTGLLEFLSETDADGNSLTRH